MKKRGRPSAPSGEDFRVHIACTSPSGKTEQKKMELTKIACSIGLRKPKPKKRKNTYPKKA
jgi:hypothetical protein